MNIGDITPESNMISASMLSTLAEEHEIDVFLLLINSLNYLPDVKYVSAPIVSWTPLNTEHAHAGMPDFLMLRNYHAVAALAPFAKESI